MKVKIPVEFAKASFLLLVCSAINLHAERLQDDQGLTLSGTVISSQDEAPIPGVSILIKGTADGTTTNADGAFSIVAKRGDVLLFSFIGYMNQEVAVSDQTTLNITMRTDIVQLGEVVVIGYGTVRRQDYTGSVSSVSMENSPVALMPNLNVLETLKGNVAGLNIGATTTAGAQPSMLIRGQNSISGSNNPLIVLDGVVYLGNITDINPNDIASIDILKDASSAAAYGSRSANGVIAITTKKGKTGKPVINFRTTAGIQTWQNRPVVMKGEEWMRTVNARNKNPEGTTSWLKAGELENLAAGKETVWLDEVTRTGVFRDYQASISGASDNVSYYLSSTYSQNKGIVVGDDFNRISVLGKINTAITDWLELGVDAGYNTKDYSGFPANVGEAQTMSPYGVMYRDDKGNLEKYPYTQSGINPLWGVDDGTRENMDIRQNFRLSTYAIISAPNIKGLTYRVNFLANLDKDRSGNFYNENYFVGEGEGLVRYEPSTVAGFLTKANGNLQNSTIFSYVVDNILNYKNTFDKHSVDLTVVATRDFRRFEQINVIGSDFSANGNTALGMRGLHKAAIQKANLNADERANIGYLGRVSYSFDDKYFITSSYRRDGASVFGSNNKWANFAALGSAWKISNEAFMSGLTFIDDMKLKLTWGQNGNQGIDPYETLSTIANGASSGYMYQFSNAPGVINYGMIQSALGNSDLGWEKTETWNTGFESAWFGNRVFLDLDIYYSTTTDQIFTRQIPVMTGFKTVLASLGQVNNSGVELTLRTVNNIQSSGITFNTAVTFWKNNNRLVKLYGEDNDGDGIEDDDIANSLFIGKSLGAIYGYEQDGIVQVDDTEYIALTGAIPGVPKYKDLDGVPGISAEDRTILGYSKENFRLNLSNTISFRNFELYTMFTGTFGGDNFFLKSNYEGYRRFNDNTTSKSYWSPEAPGNNLPVVYFPGDGRYLQLQSRGFVRIQDVALAYTFNQPWVASNKINSLKVFVSAKNLATFTDWLGGDPETGTTIAQNTFPVPTTYSIGANISF